MLSGVNAEIAEANERGAFEIETSFCPSVSSRFLRGEGQVPPWVRGIIFTRLARFIAERCWLRHETIGGRKLPF